MMILYLLNSMMILKVCHAWIESSPVEFLEKQINDQKIPHATVHTIPNIEDSLKEAFRISRQTAKRVVVCGSLYLVADVLRI